MAAWCRSEFQLALQAHETLLGSNSSEPPTWRALGTVFLASSIPFIAFGFLDNFSECCWCGLVACCCWRGAYAVQAMLSS